MELPCEARWGNEVGPLGGGQRYYYDFSYSVNREGGTGTSCPPVYFSTPVSLPLPFSLLFPSWHFSRAPGILGRGRRSWGKGKKKLLLLLVRGAKPNPPLLSHAPKNWVLARRQGRSVALGRRQDGARRREMGVASPQMVRSSRPCFRGANKKTIPPSFPPSPPPHLNFTKPTKAVNHPAAWRTTRDDEGEGGREDELIIRQDEL